MGHPERLTTRHTKRRHRSPRTRITTPYARAARLYNLAIGGLTGASNGLHPRTFNLRRQTLPTADTYITSNPFPPKHKLDGCCPPGGIGSMAFTRPS